MKQKALHTVLAISMIAAGVFATPQAHASKEKPVIGFSIDDLRVERWTKDRDYFSFGNEDHSFQFPGPGTPGFKLNYTLANGGTLGEEEPPSTWAVFRFFFGADTVGEFLLIPFERQHQRWQELVAVQPAQFRVGREILDLDEIGRVVLRREDPADMAVEETALARRMRVGGGVAIGPRIVDPARQGVRLNAEERV